MLSFAFRVAVNAVAIWLASELVSGIELSSRLWEILLVAVVFGLVNALIKPLVQLLTLPFVVVTLGLFTLVINAAMLGLTDWLTTALDVTGFAAAFWGALVISIVSFVLSLLSVFLFDD